MTISIITVTYNAERTVSDCLGSIRQQSYQPQHIVVDGGSTDSTLNIVREHGLSDMSMVSEGDDGIYHAMNKGLEMADGEVIGFLNGDDEYASINVLESVMAVFEDTDVEACYGDLIYVQQDNPSKIIRNWRSGQYDRRKFYWGWMPPHPTVFVRKQVYEQYGRFNLQLGSAADYELMLRFMVKHSIRVAYLPEILVKMRTGGVSNATLKNRMSAHCMDHLAWKVNGLKPYPWTVLMKPIRKLPQWFFRSSNSLER